MTRRPPFDLVEFSKRRIRGLQGSIKQRIQESHQGVTEQASREVFRTHRFRYFFRRRADLFTTASRETKKSESMKELNLSMERENIDPIFQSNELNNSGVFSKPPIRATKGLI